MTHNWCHGPSCHEKSTLDRIRGSKGDKHYETRKRSSFYYLGGNACDTRCLQDWFDKFGKLAVDHFGRPHEPKRTDCDNAWYKDYKYKYGLNGRTTYDHYFVNDLLGQRIPITEEQYNNPNLTQPS